MSKRDELIELRHRIKRLTEEANSLPKALRSEGIDVEIDKLKVQEAALIKTMTYEEIHGAEIAATEQAMRGKQLSALKSKRTLMYSGIAAGIILLTATTIVIIYKKRKK